MVSSGSKKEDMGANAEVVVSPKGRPASGAYLLNTQCIFNIFQYFKITVTQRVECEASCRASDPELFLFCCLVCGVASKTLLFPLTLWDRYVSNVPCCLPRALRNLLFLSPGKYKSISSKIQTGL